MNDLIYRQAVIDALCDNCNNVQAVCPHYPCKQYTAIDVLPPAQPEIIRCYECKHGVHSGNGDRYICIVSPELRMEHKADFFCGYAKRKGGEEDE